MNNELHKSFDRSSPFPFRQYMHDIENVVYVENLRKAILNGATEQDLLKSMRKARKIRKAQLMQPAPSGETAAPAEVSTPYSSRQGQAERSFDPDKGITAGSLSAPDPDSTTFGVDGGDVRVSNKQVRQMLGRQNIDNLSDADRQQVLQAMKQQPQANNPAPSQDLSASMPKIRCKSQDHFRIATIVRMRERLQKRELKKIRIRNCVRKQCIVNHQAPKPLMHVMTVQVETVARGRENDRRARRKLPISWRFDAHEENPTPCRPACQKIPCKSQDHFRFVPIALMQETVMS